MTYRNAKKGRELRRFKRSGGHPEMKVCRLDQSKPGCRKSGREPSLTGTVCATVISLPVDSRRLRNIPLARYSNATPISSVPPSSDVTPLARPGFLLR
jgi:hypothetical protein